MPTQHRKHLPPIQALAFLFAFGAATAGIHSAALAADAAAGKKEAKKCQACHGIDGISKQAHVPHIAGESDIYLIKQLKAFRSGERQDPQMSVMAKPLSDEDIANLAAWYSSIKITVTLPD
ncbi:MAG: c-type cytochrome [Dongiaceae bacterium]